MQANVPFTLLYLPTEHKVHGPPFGPVAPTLHTHDPITALPAPETELTGQPTHVPAPLTPTVVEYVFISQSTQLPFPVTVLYFPVTHNIHAVMPDESEYAPAGQFRHALTPATPEYVPSRQLVHTAEELAPAVIEYVPVEQLTHTLALVAPVTPEYVPTTQFVHAELPPAAYVPA